MSPQINEMEEEDIIKKIADLFVQFGIKSLTMDDISSKLGISKKTLYQFVSSKKDLVKKVVQIQIKNQQEELQKLLEGNGNAVDRLMDAHRYIGSLHSFSQNQMLLFDIQKYHPEAWSCVSEHKVDYIYQSILNNLKMGINDGLYRKNIIPELIGQLYLAMVSVFTTKGEVLYESYSKEDVYSAFMEYYLRGVLSEKGLEYFKQKEKEQ